jgi:Hypervirulence associated proteins TUDOR domain
MPKTLKPGDAVTWKSHAGEAHGKVVRKLTKRTHIKGHEVAASADNPEFLVETVEGKQAAHKPTALTKT